MAEHDDQITRGSGEGIRIIGAEEAATALETGAAERRLPPEAPRRGDLPEPLRPGDRPAALRFPLEGEEEAYGDTEGVAGSRVEPPAGARSATSHPDLPHWTEPATGEVPRILAGSEEPTDETNWSGSGFGSAARWRDSGQDWDEADFGDTSALGDEETRIGALDSSRTEHSDLYSFDEPAAPPPTRIRTRAAAAENGPAGPGRRHATGARPPAPRAGGRDNAQAMFIGLALAAVYLLASAAGPPFLLVMAAAIVVALTAEIFAALRRAGYKPATLLALVATVSMMFGAYWKGERALPLVLVLTVVFTFLWYLAGVVHARPTVNVAASIMGFAWGGLLGGYAALLVRPGPGVHRKDGVVFLFVAVVCTVVNDVVGYVAGQAFGRRPLAPAVSPSKTWEGFAFAFVATVLTGFGIIGTVSPHLVGHKNGFIFACVIAVVAPLGDLSQSMIKRDIGLKDMAGTLPGHGGLSDRFDGLLFALPATYYLVQVLHLAH